MSGSLTYVYCLVRSARRPALRAVPAGIAGSSEPRALDAGHGLWVVVATVPREAYDETALARGLPDLEWVGRCAMAHESVVEHFLSARALLPMQLFTLFTSDDRALEHVARDRARVDRILSRIEGQLEWGVRLTFDEKGALAAVPVRAGASASGSAYLVRKRDLLDVTRARFAEARAEADRLYAAMVHEASEAHRSSATEQAAPGSRLLLDASFLVPIRRTAAFRAALRRNARALGARGVVISVTGPWPPYHFITPPAGGVATGPRTRAATSRAKKTKPSAARRARAPRAGKRTSR